MSQAFTPTQRAELRDAFARSRMAAADVTHAALVAKSVVAARRRA